MLGERKLAQNSNLFFTDELFFDFIRTFDYAQLLIAQHRLALKALLWKWSTSFSFLTNWKSKTFLFTFVSPFASRIASTNMIYCLYNCIFIDEFMLWALLEINAKRIRFFFSSENWIWWAQKVSFVSVFKWAKTIFKQTFVQRISNIRWSRLKMACIRALRSAAFFLIFIDAESNLDIVQAEKELQKRENLVLKRAIARVWCVLL